MQANNRHQRHHNHSDSKLDGASQQHGHSGGGHSHHGGCSHHRELQTSCEQYFDKMAQMINNKQYQHYCMEILKGKYLQKKLQSCGLASIASLNCQVVIGVIGMFHMMLNFQWLPSKVRPFLSGMFWPLLTLLLLNYNILVGFKNQDPNRKANIFIIILPLILYTLAALRGPGSVLNRDNVRKGVEAFELRPYLQNPPLKCIQCKIPKLFRTMHCPVCKQCIPKFTRHSLVFGGCIGAANQILCLLFFITMTIFTSYSIIQFWVIGEQFGMITKIMFYSINLYLCWISFVEFCTLLVMNLYYGITQHQINAYVMLQYLMNVPQRTFRNSCNQGLFHNTKQSLYALLNIPGFQSESTSNIEDKEDLSLLNEQVKSQNNNLSFPQLDSNTKYVINWAKAFIYLIPQMPNHPARQKVIRMMVQNEPKMIQNYRLMQNFKDQVQKQNPQLSDMEKRQKAMMKMQQHLMKHGSPTKPSPQQQKMIQLQMLGHLKQQFKNNQQIFKQFQSIQNKLKSGQINPDQAGASLKELQGKIMQIQMEKALLQHHRNIAQQQKKNEEIIPKKQEQKNQNLLGEQKQQESAGEQQNALQKSAPKFIINNNSIHQNASMQHSMMTMPQPAQQKQMILLAISGMKNNFKDDTALFTQFNRVEQAIKTGAMSIEEAGVAMRGFQQQIMQKKMQQMSGQQGQNPFMMSQPTAEQQKSMMLMGIGKLKTRFCGHEQLCAELSLIQSNIRQDRIQLQQAKGAMMLMQQKIMQIMSQSNGMSQSLPQTSNISNTNNFMTKQQQIRDDQEQ